MKQHGYGHQFGQASAASHRRFLWPWASGRFSHSGSKLWQQLPIKKNSSVQLSVRRLHRFGYWFADPIVRSREAHSFDL
jgi:hypothetical protein